MKKKNILTIALSLCLAAVIAVGATLAYFTDNTKEKQNAFTTGNVKIELVDESEPGKVDPDDQDSADMVIGDPKPDGKGITYDDIMPGDVISKHVGVTLMGTSQPAWVAIKVSVTATPGADSTLTADAAKTAVEGLISAQIKTNEWEVFPQEDGSVVYCYKTALEPAWDEESQSYVDVTKDLFTRLNIPGNEWGNDYADLSFDIDVKAAAVQEANLDAPAMVPSEENPEVDEPNTSLEQLIDLLNQADSETTEGAEASGNEG